MKFKDSIKQALSNSAQTPTFFPDWFYTNPELLSQEIKSIFRKIWLYVGNARCLAEAGTVWVTEVGDCSILIVRTAKDQLKAFHNLCPHRASLLLPQTGVQRVKRLVCPYHAWVYSLEGDLMQTPAADRFPECFRREDFPLKPILCQEWQGFIFVALAPDVPSLPQFLGAAGKTLQTHSTPSTQLLVQKQYEVACNWKNYHDNTLCDYHVRFVHPQTLNPVQGIVSKYEHYFEQYVNLLYNPTTKSWRATNSVMAKLNNRDRFGFYTYSIFPNLHLLALPNGVIAWLRIDRKLGTQAPHFRAAF